MDKNEKDEIKVAALLLSDAADPDKPTDKAKALGIANGMAMGSKTDWTTDDDLDLMIMSNAVDSMKESKRQNVYRSSSSGSGGCLINVLGSVLGFFIIYIFLVVFGDYWPLAIFVALIIVVAIMIASAKPNSDSEQRKDDDEK